MEKPTLKRAFAYIIDLMIVVFIIGLFTNIEALNPNYEKYEQAFESYKTLIAESENTNNSQTVKQATNVMYDLNKYSVSTSIINVVVMVLYFGLFQYYNKGQTIGKKLMKIKVVSNDGKKLKLSQVIIRMLIINSVLTSVILICLISFASKGLYISTSKYINMIDATLYMVGKHADTGEYVENAMSCSMCKRVIINSGISKIVIRDTKTKFREILVQDLIDNDESIEGIRGY